MIGRRTAGSLKWEYSATCLLRLGPIANVTGCRLFSECFGHARTVVSQNCLSVRYVYGKRNDFCKYPQLPSYVDVLHKNSQFFRGCLMRSKLFNMVSHRTEFTV